MDAKSKKRVNAPSEAQRERRVIRCDGPHREPRVSWMQLLLRGRKD